MSDDPIKDALNRIPYGFYSLTSTFEGDDNAMVFNWFTQVSFSPRLVVIGLSTKAYTHGLIKKSGVFTVNLFRKEDQEAISSFTKSRAKRPDKMEGTSFTRGPSTGCPVIEGAAAYMECKVVNFVQTGGDHELMVGEVLNAGILKEGEVGDTLTLPDIGWSYAG